MSGVCAHQLIGDSCQLVVRKHLWDLGKLATAPEALEMILQAEKPVAKGATEIRRRGPEDETCVVERQHKICLLHKASVEICDWPGH